MVQILLSTKVENEKERGQKKSHVSLVRKLLHNANN